jgi:DNA-binding transcriptional regulator YiaG
MDKNYDTSVRTLHLVWSDGREVTAKQTPAHRRGESSASAPRSLTSAPTQPQQACRDASSCSLAVGSPDAHECRAASRIPSHRQPAESVELSLMESSVEIKRRVYWLSNAAFNKGLNAPFSLACMGQQHERPIDRALERAKALGLNQSQFAAKLLVDPQHVTNWKRRGMPPEYHAKAAEVLNWSVDQLLGRQSPSWPFRIPLRELEGLEPHQLEELEEIIEDRIARFKLRRPEQKRQQRGGR